MNTNTSPQLEQFRLAVYHSFARRADAAMELLDALTGNTTARSVVELSLASGFRRTYSSVYAAVGECFPVTQAEHRRQWERTLLRLVALRLAPPPRRKFWLFGIDATSVPRVFAPTLPDRGYVHCANPIGGNKPITLGHQYSLLAYLPDKLPDSEPAWIAPLIWRRISSQESELAVAVAQVETLLADERLPFHNDLCVQVEDSRYSTPAFLHPVAQHTKPGHDCPAAGHTHAVSSRGAGCRRGPPGWPSALVWRPVCLAQARNLGPTGADQRDHLHQSARPDLQSGDPGLA